MMVGGCQVSRWVGKVDEWTERMMVARGGMWK